MYTVITCWYGQFSVLQYKTQKEADKMVDAAEKINECFSVTMYGPDGKLLYAAAKREEYLSNV